MVRFLAFAALIGTASPALTSQGPIGWSEYDAPYSIDRASHRSRAYVYFGQEPWGSRQFSRDDAYFHGRGGGVAVVNGEAMFDYDRDYPYDFPTRWGAEEPSFGFEGNELAAEPACTEEPVRDRRSGRSATVRICR
jgi:hypothetical protein